MNIDILYCRNHFMNYKLKMEDKNKNSQKRKITQEKRKFQEKCGILFFVIEQKN